MFSEADARYSLLTALLNQLKQTSKNWCTGAKMPEPSSPPPAWRGRARSVAAGVFLCVTPPAVFETMVSSCSPLPSGRTELSTDRELGCEHCRSSSRSFVGRPEPRGFAQVPPSGSPFVLCS